jgi:hypothetical protein
MMMNESTQLKWECYRLPGVSAPDAWREMIERQLSHQDCPYEFDVYGTSIRAWLKNSPVISVPQSDLKCRNAYRLQRVAFGGDRTETLIGLSIARVVFEPGSSRPSFLSATELFQKGQYPATLRHQPSLGGIKDLIDYLTGSAGLSQLIQHQEWESEDLSEQIVYRSLRRTQSLASFTNGAGLSKNLLGLVRSEKAICPASIRLGLLSGGVRQLSKAMEIAGLVNQVLREWGCPGSMVDLGGGDAIEDFLANDAIGNPIILIPLEGKLGDRPPVEAFTWMKYLNDQGIAFQICSTSSNPMYTRHGLAIAILAKAGGIHFSTEPLHADEFRRCWFIGLDLGRGGLDDARVVVITLTDSNGRFLAYWRAIKNKTESLPLHLLIEGIRWIADQARSIDPRRNIVLIRDGRIPKDEQLEDYATAMNGLPFTLVEYAKGGAPLIHRNHDQPSPGTLVIPTAAAYSTFYPCQSPQAGILTSPVKFSMPFNSMKLSPHQMGTFLTALCHAPTLSYQPASTPAPIQWANGLAKLSYTDLQFSGWSHLPNHTVDLRT